MSHCSYRMATIVPHQRPRALAPAHLTLDTLKETLDEPQSPQELQAKFAEWSGATLEADATHALSASFLRACFEAWHSCGGSYTWIELDDFKEMLSRAFQTQQREDGLYAGVKIVWRDEPGKDNVLLPPPAAARRATHTHTFEPL